MAKNLKENLEVIGVTDKVPLKRAIPLSIQHLFAMFGASILVPILFNIDPATVFFFNGIGTLLYAFITKGKIPALYELIANEARRHRVRQDRVE